MSAVGDASWDARTSIKAGNALGNPVFWSGRGDPLSRIRRIAPQGLAALFIASGTLHLLRPNVFAAAVPAALPAPGAIIAISGIAELICAGALLSGQRWAGPISAMLLVAIFPGNVTVALSTAADPSASRRARVAAWARLPLQVPLVWAALQAGKAPKQPVPGAAARLRS